MWKMKALVLIYSASLKAAPIAIAERSGVYKKSKEPPRKAVAAYAERQDGASCIMLCATRGSGGTLAGT